MTKTNTQIKNTEIIDLDVNKINLKTINVSGETKTNQIQSKNFENEE